MNDIEATTAAAIVQLWVEDGTAYNSRGHWLFWRPATPADIEAGNGHGGAFWLDASGNPYAAATARRPSDRLAHIASKAKLRPLTPGDGAIAARRGQFVAAFPTADAASDFFDRILHRPEGDYVVPGSVVRNRAGNGRIIAWTADPARLAGTEGTGEFAQPRWLAYWLSMAETVGYYGSTFGEPPAGTGRRTAYLNGRACPASM